MAEDFWEFYIAGDQIQVKKEALGEFLRQWKAAKQGKPVENKGLDKKPKEKKK